METEIELISRKEALVASGLKLMREKYGKESASPKEFHNEEHVENVKKAVREIGEQAGLRKKEILYLEIAAAYHDTEVELGPGQGEDESARLCAEAMKQKGWSEEEIKIVTDLIKATKYKFENGTILQEVGDNPDEITQEGFRIGLMKRVMADADLSANGANWEDYEKWSIAIGKESNVVSIEMSQESWLNFWKWQHGFLDGLLNKRGGFYTEAAKLEYSNMEKNLETVVEKIRSLGGSIEEVKEKV